MCALLCAHLPAICMKRQLSDTLPITVRLAFHVTITKTINQNTLGTARESTPLDHQPLHVSDRAIAFHMFLFFVYLYLNSPHLNSMVRHMNFDSRPEWIYIYEFRVNPPRYLVMYSYIYIYEFWDHRRF